MATFWTGWTIQSRYLSRICERKMNTTREISAHISIPSRFLSLHFIPFIAFNHYQLRQPISCGFPVCVTKSLPSSRRCFYPSLQFAVPLSQAAVLSQRQPHEQTSRMTPFSSIRPATWSSATKTWRLSSRTSTRSPRLPVSTSSPRSRAWRSGPVRPSSRTSTRVVQRFWMRSAAASRFHSQQRACSRRRSRISFARDSPPFSRWDCRTRPSAWASRTVSSCPSLLPRTQGLCRLCNYFSVSC